MIRLSLAYFYNIGVSFRDLRDCSDSTDKLKVWLAAHSARETVTGMLSENIMMGIMRATFQHGQELHGRLDKFIESFNWEEDISKIQVQGIVVALERFETVLRSELSIADAYYVIEKKGYNTQRLITDATVLFPDSLLSKVPESLRDLRECGRCIAFELPTAAGFHLMRALEAVIRRYWDTVTGGARHPDQRNIGVYLGKMKSQEVGDAKVIAALTQLKDLHRNTLMHPEDVLDLDEIISLLGMVQSVMTVMLKVMPIVEPDEPKLDLQPPTLQIAEV